MENQAPTMNSRSWIILFAVSAIWAASFLFVEIALEEVPSLTIMTARVTIGAVGLYAMLRIFRVRWPGRAQVSRLGLLALFFTLGLTNNVVPFSLIVWSQTHLSASLASILNATMPLFVVFLAHFFTKDEKLSWPKFIGVMLGFAGVVIIVSAEGLDLTSGDTIGKFTMLGAACSYAIAALIARHFGKLRLDPLVIAFGQSAAAAVIALPIAGFLEEPWRLTISGQVWITLIALGLLCSSVAYALYFRLIATAGATNASLVTLLIPPFAIVAGILFLGESLTLMQLTGMTAIGLGLLVTDGRIPLGSAK